MKEADFDREAFVERLRDLIERRTGGYHPAVFAKAAKEWRKGLSHKNVSDAISGTMPGLDLARAFAKAGGVSLDELAGDEGAFVENRYRRALIVLLSSKDRVEKIDAFGKVGGLTRHEVFERFIDFLLATETKRGKK